MHKKVFWLSLIWRTQKICVESSFSQLKNGESELNLKFVAIQSQTKFRLPIAKLWILFLVGEIFCFALSVSFPFICWGKYLFLDESSEPLTTNLFNCMFNVCIQRILLEYLTENST